MQKWSIDGLGINTIRAITSVYSRSSYDWLNPRYVAN